MAWIERPEQPMVNMEQVAAVVTRKKEGYPEVYVVFVLSNGHEIEWELNNYDEAHGVILQIRTIVSPKTLRITN